MWHIIVRTDLCPHNNGEVLITKTQRTMNKFCSFYIRTVAILLGITAIAKLISLTGTQGILDVADSLISMKNRHLLLVMAILESLTVLFLILSKNNKQKLVTINFLSIGFLTYHCGIYLLGAPTFCPCLGHITDQLHISQNVADAFIRFIIVYMFLGSALFLGSTWMKLTMPIRLDE